MNEVYTLKTYFDNIKLKQSLNHSKNVIIVGSNREALEFASTIKSSNENINIFIMDEKSKPFDNLLGQELSQEIIKYLSIYNFRLYEKKGIKFILNSKITNIKSKDKESKVNKVSYVYLNSLQNYEEEFKLCSENNIDADLVLFTGKYSPNTEILQSVITLQDNLAKCDNSLVTSDPNILVAGDITSCPDFTTFERTNTPYIINSKQQGINAACNLMGRNTNSDNIPTYNLKLFNNNLQIVGSIDNYDDIFIQGKLEEMKFSQFYVKDRKIVGLANMNTPFVANIIYEALKNNFIISAQALKNNELTLDKIKEALMNMPSKCDNYDCICNQK